jgi:hypothetical protein
MAIIHILSIFCFSMTLYFNRHFYIRTTHFNQISTEVFSSVFKIKNYTGFSMRLCITNTNKKHSEKFETVGRYGNVIIIVSYLSVIPQANL